MKTTQWIVVLGAAAALTACGGGGDAAPGPLPTDAVPESANASPAGLGDWLMALATTAPEDREPLAATRFAPPLPDDTEPAALP